MFLRYYLIQHGSGFYYVEVVEATSPLPPESYVECYLQKPYADLACAKHNYDRVISTGIGGNIFNHARGITFASHYEAHLIKCQLVVKNLAKKG